MFRRAHVHPAPQSARRASARISNALDVRWPSRARERRHPRTERIDARREHLALHQGGIGTVRRVRSHSKLVKGIVICEAPMKVSEHGLTATEAAAGIRSFRSRVMAAAPALMCLDAFEFESTIESRSDRLFAVGYLIPRRQELLQWAGAGEGDWQSIAERDLESLKRSIRARQISLDGLAARVRGIGVDVLASLDREGERLLSNLRKHGGKTVDFHLPGASAIRLAFPGGLFTGDRRRREVRITGRVHSVQSGSAKLADVCARENGELKPVVGIQKQKLSVRWRPGTNRRMLSALLAAVEDRLPIEVDVELDEQGIPPIVRDAWLIRLS